MQKLLAYLQLVRLPTVFTAMADIMLGFVLTHTSLSPRHEFAFLLLGSSCLYLAGMVFNDVFDRSVDAELRPGRPIPSGRVPLMSAVRLGILLVAAGIGSAPLVGTQSLFVALLLSACVFAYNGLLKQTPLGPPAMGACRFLNVMLGASAGEQLWSVPQLPIAAGLGIYIVGVTWFARTEATRSSRRQLLGAMVTINIGLAVLLADAVRAGESKAPIFVLTIVLLTINRRLAKAISTPEAPLVQAAIKTMLMSVIMLDATLVLAHGGDSMYAIATAGLLIPTIALARVIPMT
ncbi:MAG: hypothetical protein CMJ48_12850 [Planctomycetaceae bacterium]|nr:hypothetical protein [Planctomycetaceae bacterium]